MYSPRRSALSLALASALASLVAAGCAPEGAVGDDPSEPSTDEIVAGREARNVPYLCTVNLTTSRGTGACTGTLVAGNVILTAAHCLGGSPTSGEVRCPYSREPRATVAVAQYVTASDGSRGDADVALLRLARPVRETRYATVDLDEPYRGSLAISYGRTLNGAVTSRVYRSSPFQLTAVSGGVAYASLAINQGGDSGGPVVDAMTGRVFGVNSKGYDTDGDGTIEREDCEARQVDDPDTVCSIFSTLHWVSGWYRQTVADMTR